MQDRVIGTIDPSGANTAGQVEVDACIQAGRQ
jgi:hypothetical protein